MIKYEFVLIITLHTKYNIISSIVIVYTVQTRTKLITGWKTFCLNGIFIFLFISIPLFQYLLLFYTYGYIILVISKVNNLLIKERKHLLTCDDYIIYLWIHSFLPIIVNQIQISVDSLFIPTSVIFILF